MKKVSVMLILISCFFKSFSQFLNPHDFNEHVSKRFDVCVYNASDLFDSSEIKARKIKSAALLQTYGGSTVFDTLFIYYFDTTGKAFAQISFTVPEGDSAGVTLIRDKVCDINESKMFPLQKDNYVVFNYTPYGIERKTYSNETHELLDSEFIVTLNCGDVYIQTNERSELIAYRLESGSALIGRIVSIQMDKDYYAAQYIIRYKAD